MFTPQEIQERSSSLEKAVFGGYSMDSVEELLTPLAEDYSALYKENAVLKSKMKVLVERLEEYRKQEEGINRALLAAQKTADDLVSEAERKCARMMAETEQKLRQRSQELKNEVAAETERVALAKKAAARFISDIEQRVESQLSQLEQLKQMNLTVRETEQPERKSAAKLSTAPGTPVPKAPEKNPVIRKEPEQPQPEPEETAPVPEPIPEPGQELSDDDMARQIEENITRILAESANVEQPQDLGDTRVIEPVG